MSAPQNQSVGQVKFSAEIAALADLSQADHEASVLFKEKTGFTPLDFQQQVVEALSAEFTLVICSYLTPEQMKSVRSINAQRNDPFCCATHDFCDANMAMEESWGKVMGAPINVQDQNQAALWNKAWELSIVNGFSQEKINNSQIGFDDQTDQLPDAGYEAAIAALSSPIIIFKPRTNNTEFDNVDGTHLIQLLDENRNVKAWLDVEIYETEEARPWIQIIKSELNAEQNDLENEKSLLIALNKGFDIYSQSYEHAKVAELFHEFNKEEMDGKYFIEKCSMHAQVFTYQLAEIPCVAPINVTIENGLLTMPDGRSVDLNKIQSALNNAFQESGDHEYMTACDQMAVITGITQGPSCELVLNKSSVDDCPSPAM